jgi:hypothetical protein
VCGLLAERLPERRPVVVTLRRPVPLERELAIADDGAGGMVLSCDGEPLAVAHVGEDPQVGEIPAIDLEAARAAVADPDYVRTHPFPGCFGCGPLRDRDTAVALLPGPVGDGVLATAWTPGPQLPTAPGDALAPVAVWAALDCTTAAAAVPSDVSPHVLGRLEGRVDHPVPIGEEVVVVSWPLRHEGRKRWGATALLTPAGELLALSRATWIALRQPPGEGDVTAA